MHTGTLVIGAGLTGLRIAQQLASDGQNVLLLEARARVGGRIKSEMQNGAGFDMGPAWFWPGQSRMEQLVTRLGLTRFEQYTQGDMCMEPPQGPVQRGRGNAAMAGSFRVDGGLGALTDALAGLLPPDTLKLSHHVTALHDHGAHVEALLRTGATIHAQRVILAMPPRIAATLQFAPALPPQAMQTLQTIPTWMAGQAKALATYDTPFWRNAGLSGDAMSHRGPMVEIHDASPHAGGPYALFGFIGMPAAQRADAQALRDATLAQLVRLFGPDAANPASLWIKDWAQDPFTATQADQAPMTRHPTYGPHPSLSAIWDDRLIFAGSELASDFGGYLEGALASAETTLESLA